MLSYRHAFHAGNHADILKHLTLVMMTRAYCRKDKPFVYFDTHAGAGLYTLDDARALQTGEAAAGICRVLQADSTSSAEDSSAQQSGVRNALPQNLQIAQEGEGSAPRQETAEEDALEQYLAFCRSLYNNGKHYPGSPAVVAHFARPQDQLVLMELHPTEIENLRNTVLHLSETAAAATDLIHVHKRSGFEGLCSLTPPKPPLPARGFVLIDPSYEIDSDFSHTADTVLSVCRRWKNAAVAVWYPLLTRRSAEIAQLKDTFIVNGLEMLCAEFTVCEPQEQGLYGSGMLVINPPWKLQEQLEDALPRVLSLLGVQNGGGFSVSIENNS